MKIKYDAYISGSNYVLNVTVTDKSPLDTDKIFITDSTTDEFVKIATLAELTSIPDIRYQESYYRKNYALITKPTLVEADTIRKIIDSQINSLANEASTVQEFYKSETEIEYPSTQITSDVDKLYNEYLTIKDQYNSLIQQRAELTAKKSTLEADFDYFTKLIDPVMAQFSSVFSGIDISSYIPKLLLIKDAIVPFKNSLNSMVTVLENYITKDNIDLFNATNADLNNIIKIFINKEYILNNYVSLYNAFNAANSELSTIRHNMQNIVRYTISNDGTMKAKTIFDEDVLNSAISDLNSISSEITSTETKIMTLAVTLDSIKNKYNKEIKDLDTQIMKINRQIDTTGMALQELKSEILEKDPTFNLSLL